MSWIPVLKYLGTIGISGMVLYVTNYIFDEMQQFQTDDSYWSIINLVISGMAVFVIIGATVWLFFKMQKQEYLEG